MDNTIKINADLLYYFLIKHDDRYVTAFIGWFSDWLLEKMLHPINCADGLMFDVSVAEHQFKVITNKPLYLLNYEKTDALEYARDNATLDLYPSGNVPHNKVAERVIHFPTYWDPGVEPLLDFAIGEQLLVQHDGQWFPVNLQATQDNGGTHE